MRLPRQFLTEHVEFIGVAHFEIHRGGEKFDRIIRFKIRGLIGDQRIGRRMRFVKAVAREFVDLVENHRRPDRGGTPCCSPRP